ncbi:MAG: integrase arm-type DNA-binding domain-containing protein [Gammaproteobacteria bacterium]
MPLTDRAIRMTKPGEKPKRLFDERGMYLIINPNGSRWWRFKYRFHGREKLISLGVYPEVSLKKARQRRDEARQMVADGIDPSMQRQAQKGTQANTFEAVGNEWLGMQKGKLAPATYNKAKWMLETLLYPYIGKYPIASINAPQLLPVLRRVEAKGKRETAHRLRQRCGQVFRYAIATGRADRDPAADLRDALAPVIAGQRAAITEPGKVGELLRAIDEYTGYFPTQCALRFAPLVFVRPGELRAAEWAEINLENSVWRLPPERTKMRDAHVVPLSRQAVSILEELQPLTGRGKYVFPSVRTRNRPMSNNTINAALRRLGYTKDEMTGHGFRALASTLLNEMGWRSEVIERQLAHAERNKVRAAYNRAEHLAERRKMMQAWADYLDSLKADDKKVVPMKAVKGKGR